MGNLIFSFGYIIFIGSIIFAIWLFFILKYRKKRSNITKILAIFYGLYVISLIFSIINFYNVRITTEPFFEAGTYLYYIIVDNFGYYSVIFVANYVYYLFFLEIFSSKEDENKLFSKIYLFFTIIGVLITLIPLLENMRLISGIVLLAHSLLIYIPITFRTFKLYKKIDGNERWAFFSLFIMSSFFLLLWISIVIDMIWDETFGVDPENVSIWGFIIYSIIFGIGVSSYLGFGLPKWFRKKLKMEE